MSDHHTESMLELVGGRGTPKFGAASAPAGRQRIEAQADGLGGRPRAQESCSARRQI